MLVERLPLHIPGSSLSFVTAPPLLNLFLVRIWGGQTKETLCVEMLGAEHLKRSCGQGRFLCVADDLTPQYI